MCIPESGLTAGELERGRVRGQVQRQVSITGTPPPWGLWGPRGQFSPKACGAGLPSFFSLFKHLLLSSPQHLGNTDNVLVRETGSLRPPARRTRGLCPTALWHMVSPFHSSLLGSLGDALNHGPDPLAAQALAGKQIASCLPEFLTSLSLQTGCACTDCTHVEMGGARVRRRGGWPRHWPHPAALAQD